MRLVMANTSRPLVLPLLPSKIERVFSCKQFAGPYSSGAALGQTCGYESDPTSWNSVSELEHTCGGQYPLPWQ